MRSKHQTIASLLLVLLAAASACAADGGSEVANDSEALADAPAARQERVPGIHEEVDGEPEPDAATDKAGNSYVQWCNQSGPNGTVCRQQGCSGSACISREAAARAECRREVDDICGSPTTPFYIVYKVDGFWDRLE